MHQTGGHLPAGWLSDKLSNSIADKAWAIQLLRGTLRQSIETVNTVPIGRLKKGGDPAFLYLMFTTVEAASAFCTAVDQRALPTAVSEALGAFLDLAGGQLITFCTCIPPEAIQGCNEKEFKLNALFKAAQP